MIYAKQFHSHMACKNKTVIHYSRGRPSPRQVRPRGGGVRGSGQGTGLGSLTRGPGGPGAGAGTACVCAEDAEHRAEWQVGPGSWHSG